jgi:hypothetical protein
VTSGRITPEAAHPARSFPVASRLRVYFFPFTCSFACSPQYGRPLTNQFFVHPGCAQR